MSAPKDTTVAMNVQQMAAYGYFNEEYMFYCYAFKRDEQIVYKLSESLLSIYSAYYNSVFDNVYPTPVCSLLRSTVVPAGEQIRYKTQFKMELIQNMQTLYGQPFFDAVMLFQMTQPLDTAYELLNSYLHTLSPKAEQRQLFDGLCQQAMEAKLLSPSRHQTLLATVNRLYGQPTAIIKPLSGRGKAFSGFAYWHSAGSKAEYYFSATLEDTYSKYYQLRHKGWACSPIVQKSYWYDSPNDFKTIRQAFMDFLAAMIAESQLISMVDQLRALPPAVNQEHYNMMLDTLKEAAAPEAFEAFIGYGYRFNLLHDN